jgi:hypothetical protein
MTSKTFHAITYFLRCLLAGAGITTIAAINVQPWYIAAAILAAKVGVLRLFLDLGWLPWVGPIFKVLATCTASLMAYGLYGVCQYLEVALLLNLETAKPTLWVSAGAAFLIDIGLNFWAYPPIIFNKDSWLRLMSGEGLPIDYFALFMLLVSVLALEVSTRLFWYPLVRRYPVDGFVETSLRDDRPAPKQRPKRFRRRRKQNPQPQQTIEV